MDLRNLGAFVGAAEIQRRQFSEASSIHASHVRINDVLPVGAHPEISSPAVAPENRFAESASTDNAAEESTRQNCFLDPGEKMLMASVWGGSIKGHRRLLPSCPMPVADSHFSLLESRNRLSSYVLSAFH